MSAGEDPFAGPSGPPVSAPFLAAFFTACPWCGSDIEVGDSIRMVDGEGAVHDECYEDDAAGRR